MSYCSLRFKYDIVAGNNTILAVTLSEHEIVIGLNQHHTDRGACSRHAQTESKRYDKVGTTAGRKTHVSDFRTYQLEYLRRFCRISGKKNCKFFTAPACERCRFREQSCYRLCHFCKNIITAVMAVCVVEFLEIIYVKNGKCIVFVLIDTVCFACFELHIDCSAV